MKDLANQLQFKRALSPVSVSDNTAQVSQIIDRQGFESLTFGLLIGSVADADATFAVLMEEGDASDLSDAAAVADADMISQTPGTAPETAAGFQFDDDNEVRKIAYTGAKRYVRVTVTPSANASAALLAILAILGHPHQAPVVQAAS